MFCSICICSDPGVLPRNNIYSFSFPNSLGIKETCFMNKKKYYFIRGRKFRVKYCSSCYIFRGPAVSHCKKCDNCVDNFDHHCPWLGNCIGKNNYKFFMIFLIFFNLLVFINLFTSSFSFISKIKEYYQNGNNNNKYNDNNYGNNNDNIRGENKFFDLIKNEYNSLIIITLSISVSNILNIIQFYFYIQFLLLKKIYN